MTRLSSSLGLLVATGLTAGCFNLKDVQSGGLKCAPDRSCPDGFSCNLLDKLCYRNGIGGPSACTAAEAQAPFGPFAACTAPTSTSPGDLCDPVCQSGCPCNQRCQLLGDQLGHYSFACETPPTGTPLDNFQPCDPNSDLCKPGLRCLPPPPGSTGCVAQCYRYCRQNSDCPLNSLCALSIDIVGQNSIPICTPPEIACNPALQTAAPACSSSLTGSACYAFSKELPDQTMCDCAGTIAAGADCTDLHSCMAGYECVSGKCQKVCLLQTGGLACAVGQTCVSLNSSTKFGTCQ
jgi:hypothetical protein